MTDDRYRREGQRRYRRDYDESRNRSYGRSFEGDEGRYQRGGWESIDDDYPLGGQGTERYGGERSRGEYGGRMSGQGGYGRRSGSRWGASEERFGPSYGGEYGGFEDQDYGRGPSGYGSDYDYGGWSQREGRWGGPGRGRYGQQGREFEGQRSGGEGQGMSREGYRQRAQGGGGYGEQMSSGGYGQWYGERAGQHRGRGPKGYRRSDERIREDVCDRLSDDASVDASEIEVRVNNCEVTLSGTVESREQKRRAEDCAEAVSGVKNVQNNLRVSEGSGAGAATRSSWTGSSSAASGTAGTQSSGSSGTSGTQGSGTSAFGSDAKRET